MRGDAKTKMRMYRFGCLGLCPLCFIHVDLVWIFAIYCKNSYYFFLISGDAEARPRLKPGVDYINVGQEEESVSHIS